MRAAPSFHRRMIPAGSVTTMASADSLTTAVASHSSVMPATLEPVPVIVLPPSNTPHSVPRPIARLTSSQRTSSISNIEYLIQSGFCRGGTCAASPAGVLRGGGQGTTLRACGRELLRVAARSVDVDRQAGARAERHPHQSRPELRGSDTRGRTARRLGQACARRARRAEGRGGRDAVRDLRNTAARDGSHGVHHCGASRGGLLRSSPAGQGQGLLTAVFYRAAPSTA